MPRMFATLMYPPNPLCDMLHVSGEAERGVVRMLINTLFWNTLGVILVWAASYALIRKPRDLREAAITSSLA